MIIKEDFCRFIIFVIINYFSNDYQEEKGAFVFFVSISAHVGE
jgi:hypothetical protein